MAAAFSLFNAAALDCLQINLENGTRSKCRGNILDNPRTVCWVIKQFFGHE